jgi:uncharacterized protein (DUF927 family)
MTSGASAPFQWGSDLTAADLSDLDRRWITQEIGRQMGLRRVSSDDAGQILNRKSTGEKYAGKLIPNYWPGEAQPRGYRIRRDQPDLEVKSDGTHKEKNKYLSAYGDRNMFYFVPGTDPAWLSDSTLPIAITEGEFKTAALFRLARHGISPNDARPRFLASGLSGVWGWRSKVGKAPGPNGESLDVKGPIPDFDRINWTDRTAYIIYDANVRAKEEVRAARRSLTAELQGRGARVHWVEIPDVDGVNGIDDLLAHWQADPVLQLIKDANLTKPVRARKLVTVGGESSAATGAAPRGESPAPLAGVAGKQLPTAGSYEFELRSSGLYCKEPGDDKEFMWIASLLEVLGETRDHQNEGWGVVIQTTDGDGVTHRLVLSSTLFAGDDSEVRKALLDAGCKLSPNRKGRELVSRYLQTAQPVRRYRCVTKLGWSGDKFILPKDGPELPQSEAVLYQPSYPMELYLNVQGTLDQWRQNVASLCSGNSRLILAISAAFAGPLLAPLGMEGGGVHFFGSSSLGKTTALFVAGSVLGGGGKDGYVRSWKTTLNALESTCEAHNDLTLLLDEIGLASQYDVINCAYTIATGQGKARQTRTSQPRSLSTWRLMLLSTGERTLEEIAATVNQQVPGGAIVRLFPVPADAGCGLGLFESVHSAGSAKDFAIQMRGASLKYYGTPLRAFLERLTRDPASVESRWPSFRDGFRSEYLPEKAGEEVGRVAERFALIAYAGTLATEWGITGWKEDEADRAVGVCFAAGLRHRGTLGASDVERGIQQLKGLLERYGSSKTERFVSAHEDSLQIAADRIQERYGFRKDGPRDSTEYLILPQVFKDVLCKGFDAEAIAKELARRGHLRCDGRHYTVKHTVPGMGRPRLYTINSSLLSEESAAGGELSAALDENSAFANSEKQDVIQ